MPAIIQRSSVAQVAFTYGYCLLILAVVYFVLVGVPLWHGTAWYIWSVNTAVSLNCRWTRTDADTTETLRFTTQIFCTASSFFMCIAAYVIGQVLMAWISNEDSTASTPLHLS